MQHRQNFSSASLLDRQRKLGAVAFAAAAFAVFGHAQGVQGPSSSRTPYFIAATANAGVVRNVTSIVTATDLVPTTGALSTPYEVAGLMDGMGAYDNGDGTVTVLICHEIGTTSGAVRRHGAVGTFITEMVVDKATLQVISASDMMHTVIEANGTVRSAATSNGVALGRFCSADLAAPSAFYNPVSGLGTQDRIFMCGEEFAGFSWLLGHVASGTEKGISYVLPAFNLATNGSGINAVGSWENALANPFPQDLTLVAATNDGGSGVQNNRVSIYFGLKQATGTVIDKAGLKGGQSYFVNVMGSATEIVNSTTRATNIVSGTRFSLNATVGTQFSRPEDGHWDPLHPRDFYFVTTDRLNTVANTGDNRSFGASGPANQVGRSRLWRLRFDDIAAPQLGGVVDLLIDGSKNGLNVNMLDNMCVGDEGTLFLTEDPGNSTYLAKTYAYDAALDTLVQLVKFDPARWGELAVNGGTPGALAPHTNDKEISGVIDVTSMFPHAADERVLLINAQDHSTNPAVATPSSVEGGQLLLIRVALGARATAVGVGCNMSLTAAPASTPVLGGTFTADLASITSGATGFMMVGGSNATFAGQPLPLDLGFAGLPGCLLYQDLGLEGAGATISTGATSASYSLPIPASYTFVGLTVYLQSWSTALETSNALTVVLGL